jgi:hypothetical protein
MQWEHILSSRKNVQMIEWHDGQQPEAGNFIAESKLHSAPR